MSDSSEFELSIQLQENSQGKTKEKELQELVELTRKIAESDRNNDIYHELHKSKQAELSRARKQYQHIYDEREKLAGNHESLLEAVKEAKALKVMREEQFGITAKLQEQILKKNRECDLKSANVIKQNERLQQQISLLTLSYEQMIRATKEKQAYLAELKRKRDAQNERIFDEESKAADLEAKAEMTKQKAEHLEEDYARELELSEQLKEILSGKERELEQQRREKEDAQRRQEESKRSINKVMSMAKVLEEEIDVKLAEIVKLQGVHAKLQREVEKVEVAQRTYEEALAKRRELIASLRRSNQKVRKERDSNTQTLQNKH